MQTRTSTRRRHYSKAPLDLGLESWASFLDAVTGVVVQQGPFQLEQVGKQQQPEAEEEVCLLFFSWQQWLGV